MIRDIVLQKIREIRPVPQPITEISHLYADLGYDSLSFIRLLVAIEDTCYVTFDITEMESCLQVGRLIEYVENKQRERGEHA